MNKICTFGCKICNTEGNNVEGKQDRDHVFLATSQSKGARSPPKVRDTIKIIIVPKIPSGFGFGGGDGTGRGCAFTGRRVLATGGCQ